MIKVPTRIVVCLVVLLLAMPIAGWAAAPRQCYRPAELEAEQLLRLHSELMVITYQCKQGSRAQDLLTYYNAFTVNNLPALKKAEQTLIEFYKGVYHDDGVAHLDMLRTKLGNEFGQEAADESAPLFCRAFRDRPIALSFDTPIQLANEIRHMAVSQKSYGALCTVAQNTKTVHIDK